MRRTYKPLFWRATLPVNSTDCMIAGRYCLKRIIINIFTLYFIKYLHSFIQSAVFTGRVARQNNGLYVLRMIVKLAYKNLEAQSQRTSRLHSIMLISASHCLKSVIFINIFLDNGVMTTPKRRILSFIFTVLTLKKSLLIRILKRDNQLHLFRRLEQCSKKWFN